MALSLKEDADCVSSSSPTDLDRRLEVGGAKKELEEELGDGDRLLAVGGGVKECLWFLGGGGGSKGDAGSFGASKAGWV